LSVDNTNMTKTGNKYLRYYLIEAPNSVKNNTPEYKKYCNKKFGEVFKAGLIFIHFIASYEL